MPYGTLKKKHHDFTQKTRAALYNGGFVFLASHETGSAPIAFIFLSRSPSSPCAPPSCSAPPRHRAQNACQLVAGSARGSRALIRYCKPAYRCQAVHGPFLRLPSWRGGAQMREEGSLPTTAKRGRERTHTAFCGTAGKAAPDPPSHTEGLNAKESIIDLLKYP